jgi:acyl carrier protein
MPTRDEILDKVRTTLEDALGVEEDEVVMEATLSGDLGAESIDFLDITFRLEKEFDIKIPKGELFPDNLSAEGSFVADGKVSESGIAMLRERLPHADVDKFAEDPTVENIPNLFTVEMVVNYLEGKLNG